MSLKAEKETFVSGHDGTSVLEIAILIASQASGYALRNTLLVCVPQIARASRHSIMFSFLLDFAILVLPGILVFTLLADYAVHMTAALIGATVLIATQSILRTPSKELQKTKSFGAMSYNYTAFPFITAMRTYTNLITAIAILAVDFPVFPRRFAKTETYGTGLMDVGVGLFMLAHGITCPEARWHQHKKGYVGRLLGTWKRVLPLLVLGLMRLASVKASGYQEHVTEYGIHWNFFFTIAAVRLLCTVLQPALALIPRLPYGTCSVLLATFHQVYLSWNGGTDYVIMGPDGDGSRAGLLSANREGVVSCVGYLAVYMGSIELGRWLFHPRKKVKDFLPVFVQLCSGLVVFWTLTSLSEAYIQQISRRLANLSFILWIFSQSFLILALFLLTDLILLALVTTLPHSSLPPPLYSLPDTPQSRHTPANKAHHPELEPVGSSPKDKVVYPDSGHDWSGDPAPRDKACQSTRPDQFGRPSTNEAHPELVRSRLTGLSSSLCIVSAIDYNQLAFFLLANVLTGLVNFSLDTLHTAAPLAVCLLTLYMCVLVAVVLLLHRSRIKLKI